jgi:hypothetical protein
MKKKTRQFQYHQTLKQCDLTKKEQVHGTLVNSGLYWIEGFAKGNSFTSLYCVSKELNITPISAKCAIAQVRCFKK